MLSDSSEIEKQTLRSFGRSYRDSSKRDTKTDARLDTVFPTLNPPRAITELNPSEGPNDSVTANSIRSRKFTAAFPHSPMFGGTSTLESGTPSRGVRNASTIRSVVDSGTDMSNASRSLR